MFDLDTDQLTYASSGSGQEPDGEIASQVRLFFEAVLQKVVLFVADDIFKEGFFLDFYELELKLFFPDYRQIFVQPLKP